ncbi:hypothetical protein FH972_023213 [Carpinus fangiana]|uniref:Uncharacterized protein n=1 Tax=Carpinus fangiana TaxID=176857 RepID=A0A5N6KUY9_9ROSI|nr:hypothetical protein FH972_023213 [Carpinus fangiana]
MPRRPAWPKQARASQWRKCSPLGVQASCLACTSQTQKGEFQERDQMPSAPRRVSIAKYGHGQMAADGAPWQALLIGPPTRSRWLCICGCNADASMRAAPPPLKKSSCVGESMRRGVASLGCAGWAAFRGRQRPLSRRHLGSFNRLLDTRARLTVSRLSSPTGARFKEDACAGQITRRAPSVILRPQPCLPIARLRPCFSTATSLLSPMALLPGPRLVAAQHWLRHGGNPSRRKVLLPALIALIWFLFFPSTLPDAAEPDTRSRLEDDVEDQKIHLLIPAAEPDAELCKCILTSHILGYPTPTLIGWNKTIEDPDHDWRMDGNHIAKIVAIQNYFGSRKPAEEDVLLVVDGYDTWFQLPPSVLLSRFHRINAENLQRTRAYVGPSAADEEDIQQAVIFSAQKECGAASIVHWDINRHPMCYSVPQSPMRRDLYGRGTDAMAGPAHNLSTKLRPKFLSSGFIMGRAVEMANLIDAAHYLVHEMDHGGSDQLIFAKLFGEQSWRREYVRRWHMSKLGRAYDSFKRVLGISAPSPLDVDPAHPDHVPMSTSKSPPPELGIGLDYGLEMVNTAVWSEFDGRFLVHDSTKSLYQQQVDAGVDVSPPRLKAPLPKDILSAKPPFQLLQAGGKNVESNAEVIATPWSDVPLYTNTFTGSVPVALHLNGNPRMRQLIWHLMWYHSRLRDLLIARAHVGEIGAFDDDGHFLKWNTLCKDFHAEVFRDDFG